MSKFPKVDELVFRLQKIDILNIVNEVESEYRNEILDANRVKMLAGLDSNNISFQKSTYFKDLFDTGDFQRSMYVKDNHVFATDWKTDMILRAIPEVFGLSYDSPLAKTLKTAIIKKIKEQLNS